MLTVVWVRQRQYPDIPALSGAKMSTGQELPSVLAGYFYRVCDHDPETESTSYSRVMGERTPIGEMYLDGRVIVHVVDPHAVLDPDGAREVQRITVDLAAGSPVAVVVDMRGMAFAGRDVRGMFRDDLDGVELATALLVSSDISVALADLFKRYASPERPVEVFTSEDEALSWARGQVEAL